MHLATARWLPNQFHRAGTQGFQCSELLRARGVDHIELPAADRVRALRLFSDGAEGDLVEVGKLLAVRVGPPIVGIPHDDELLIQGPMAAVDELKRPGADHVGRARLSVVQLCGGGDPESPIQVQEHVEVHPRLRHGDGHGERIGHSNVCDVREADSEGRTLAHGIEVQLDRVRVERFPVVERDALAERDRPMGVRGIMGDGLGEIRRVVALVVEHGERVVNRARNSDAGNSKGCSRDAPPARGLSFNAVRERPSGARHGCARCPRCRHAAGRDDHRNDHADTCFEKANAAHTTSRHGLPSRR